MKSLIEKYAEVLINYCVKIKKDQLLAIRGSHLATPLIKEIYKQALKKGAHPYTRVSIEGLDETYYKNASNTELSFISPIQKYEYDKMDALISIMSSFNTKALMSVDPKKQAITARASAPIMKKMMKRTADGTFSWVGCLFPTNASAQDAGMSLDEYSNFVHAACRIDKKDPVAEWKKTSKYNARIIKYLSRKKEIRVVAKDTDLTYNVKGRKWINCDGKNNFPDGEVFTAPIENSVNGKIRFTFPAVYRGNEVENVRVEFKDGKAVKATADKGQKFLDSMLNMDKGSRYIGEVAIGTNFGIQKFTKNILFDEKIGGTIHMAFGQAYPESGGVNKSGLHWDMICDLRKSGALYADGELFFKNGKFIK